MTELVVFAALGGVLWYAAACWWYPMAKCWWCRGAGKHTSRSGRTWRPCRVCSGRGSWFRIGRRLWDWFRGAGT